MRYFYFLFLIVAIIFSGYKFPDKLPEPYSIDTYTFNRVKFGQTSVNEFAYIAPAYEKPIVEGVYTIYSEIDLDKTYKSLRAGFKNQFLDWIELEFTVPQAMSKFKKNYGNSKNINTDYSNKFNYHDYDFFNVVTDKNNVSAFGITLYGESDFNPAISEIVSKMPDYKSFNFIKEFIPGQMLEMDFNQNYSNFKPSEINQNASQKTYSIPKKYLKNNELYSEIDLVFANGVLLFVNLKPRTLSINEIKDTYGANSTNEELKNDFVFVDYNNFSVIYNKATNAVISIGIVGIMGN